MRGSRAGVACLPADRQVRLNAIRPDRTWAVAPHNPRPRPLPEFRPAQGEMVVVRTLRPAVRGVVGKGVVRGGV
ncbi:hypothetical protein GCM10010425_44090 [Streptomyces spororaveus]|uniref:Uncharacterized protein n=1 Tax=Streptomyces spororaveus TaxID=284039 RepID=A0ABQ3TMK4_9ACTN|nr:hypothetical protein Sspor_71590 [Streptomyces spororaveus]